MVAAMSVEQPMSKSKNWVLAKMANSSSGAFELLRELLEPLPEGEVEEEP